MYPILETKRLVLKPLQKNDFDNMFKIVSDPNIIATTEWILENDPKVYKKEFTEQLNSGVYFTIRKKKSDEFIGFFILMNYIDKKKCKIKYSQIMTILLPKYWKNGFCTEATEKVLHFAFLGIKTPWICANQLCTNPTAGKVLQKCGFRYYKTYKMEKGPYDQYRLINEDYIKNNPQSIPKKENVYNINLTIRKSPYSYENPIREIKSIKYVKEPTGYLCGQSVIAMLANVSVDEVIDVMETDKGTSVQEIDAALTWYGIKHGKKRERFTEGIILPDICILSLKLPGYGHWSLYYKGTFYDPEFGVLKKLPQNARLNHYWEIMN
jgi:RimJ/RimL family protein N-acetyltransferase